MANVRTADTWQRSDMSADAPHSAIPAARDGSRRPASVGHASRPIPPLPPLRSAGRNSLRAPEDDMAYGDAAEYSRVTAARRPAAARGGARHPERHPSERGRSQRPYADQGRTRGRYDEADELSARPRERSAPAPRAGDTGPRGIVAVLAVFVLTLAGGAVDSLFMGMGLGLITLGCLVGSALLAAGLVRRRDLASVVVAPPLVFVAVACINIALAPSAALNLPTMATLLVRGFPTMAMATGAALVVALVRWAARR